MELFFNPSLSNGSNSQYPTTYAVVSDVILNEEHIDYDGFNVGTIRFKYIQFGRTVGEKTRFFAIPQEIGIQDYPLIGEIVIIDNIMGRDYYTRRVNISNQISFNTHPNILPESQLLPQNDVSDGRERAKLGVIDPAPSTPPPLENDGFVENESVALLKHFQGDVIYYGRYGSSIRFGSSQMESALNGSIEQRDGKTILGPAIPGNNSPITIIRNTITSNNVKTVDSSTGLTVENVNEDDSSIVLSSNQIINFQYSSPNAPSAKDFPELVDGTAPLGGKQIIINSDRLTFNSKFGRISLTSNTDVNVSANRDFTVDVDGEIFINSPSSINLGFEPEDGIVLYSKLEEILGEIIQQFVGPFGVASGMMPVTMRDGGAGLLAIQSKISTMRSKLVKIEK